MKVTIKIEKEFDIKVMSVNAGVRYWEDSEINGQQDTEDGDNIPCKIGDSWCPEIDIETGRILNWKNGVSAEVHYKVCDQFSYELKDVNGDVIISEDDIYVPGIMYPQGGGFGDYIIMSINEDGFISGWRFDITDLSDQD